MHLEANDLLLFAQVMDEGSFSRAAERAGMPKSTVSRRIAHLESQLGERLLLRTTRKLTITDFGRSVLDHAHHVMAEVEGAAALAQQRQVRPSGRLRVSMPADFANAVLGQMLAAFVDAHPAILLELDLSPRRVDLIGENFDLALRIGDLPDDATLTARRLAVFATGLYASPAYLARRGAPEAPADLVAHQGLCYLSRQGEPIAWHLSRGEARWHGLPAMRASGNSPDVLTRMARHGAGITPIARHFAEPYLRSDELVPVLEDWSLPPAVVWAVFPGRRLMPARTRAFLDALEAEFSGPRCQAAHAQEQRRRQARKAA